MNSTQHKKLEKLVGDLGKKILEVYPELPDREPTIDPTMFWHTFDCNLHTLLFDGIRYDQAQTVKVVGGKRVQFVSRDPSVAVIVEIPDKGKASYLYLDQATQHADKASYKTIDEALKLLELKLASFGAEPDHSAKPLPIASLTVEPLSPDSAREMWQSIEKAAGKSRAKNDVELPRGFELTSRELFADLEVDAQLAVKALYLEVAKGKDLDAVRLLWSAVEPEAREALAAAFASSWVAGKRNAAARWQTVAAGRLGGSAAAAVFLEYIVSAVSDSKAHHALLAVAEALEQMGSALAVHAIYALESTPTRYAKRRNEARDTLKRIAVRHGTDVSGLIARSVPRRASGTTTKHLLAVHARRLERMMVDGKRISPGVFRGLYREHPLLGPVCEALVWGAFDAKGHLKIAFRPQGKESVDAAGKQASLPKTAKLGLAHPVELENLDEWRSALAESSQPFLQVERPTFTLTRNQSESNEIHDFKRYDRDWLHRMGWWGYKEDLDYMADVDSYATVFARDQKQVDIKLGSTAQIELIGMGRVDLDYSIKKGGHFAKPHDETCFGELHPVTQSELVYAFYPKGRGKRSPAASTSAGDPQSKARASSGSAAATGKYPYAEVAKSSRSKCLVCDEKIDKGTVRIAVEREIDTPGFKGVGAGYLHPKCAPRHEALKDAGDLDALIAGNSSIPWPP